LTAIALAAILTLGVLSNSAFAADDAKDQSKTIPVIDGGIGPCTADFTITDADATSPQIVKLTGTGLAK